MKKAVLSIILLSILILYLGCQNVDDEKEGQTENKNISEVTLKVDGMTCGSCNIAVNLALKRVDGVIDAEADYETGKAIVKFEKDQVSHQQLVDAVNKLGYKASLTEEPQKDTAS